MTKIKSTKQLSEKILGPLKKYCAENPGGIRLFMEKFNNGLEKPSGLNNFYKWLGPKPVDLEGGSLLRLLETWREIRGADVENKPEPGIYCCANGHTPSNKGTACKECGVAL